MIVSGVWQDSEIGLTLDESSLITVIREGEKGTQSRYAHWQIVQWCARFVAYYQPLDRNNPLVNLADDVIVQWELHLSSQYTLEQMQKFRQADLVLPREHFSHWRQLLEGMSS